MNIENSAILLVEDEREIADMLAYALSTEGFESTWVTTAELAIAALKNRTFSLAVFDVGLPDANGFELLKTVRTSGEHYADVPCLFLTARNEEIDRIVGLEIGADDYVCKPFSPREVVARIKAIIKRSETMSRSLNASQSEPKTIQQSAPFDHVPSRRQVTYKGHVIDFTKGEYELMVIFLGRIGHVYSRRELIERVWSTKHPSDDRAIDTHIKTLRAKLKTHAPDKDFIVTHRGHGYSLTL